MFKGYSHFRPVGFNKIISNRFIYTINYPDSKVHGANMWPTWVLSAPVGPHVGPMNLAIVKQILRNIRQHMYRWALNHWGRVMHNHHWFRWWLVAWSAPSHYLNQCCNLVNWTLKNKLGRNRNQNTQFVVHENACEDIFCEMAAISSGGDESIQLSVPVQDNLHARRPSYPV